MIKKVIQLICVILWPVGEVVNTYASQAYIHGFKPRTGYQFEYSLNISFKKRFVAFFFSKFDKNRNIIIIYTKKGELLCQIHLLN